MKKSTKKTTLNLKQRISFLPVPKNPAMDVLGCVLIKPTIGGVHLIATDLATSVRLFHPCSPGPFDPVLVPVDILKSQKEIESIQTGDGYGIMNGIKFHALSLEDMPVLPDFDKVNCMADVNIKIPQGLEKYSSKDIMRQAMQGINMDKTGWQATDAHRLFWVKRDLPINDSVILPKDFYLKVSKYNEGRMWVTPSLFELDKSKFIGFADDNGKAVFVGRPIEAKFPEVKAVIPEKASQVVSFSGQELISEINKSLVLNKMQIQLSVNGSLEIAAQNLELTTEYKASIPCSHTGDDINLNVHPVWLKEAISDGMFSNGFSIGGRLNLLINDNPEYTFLMVSNHN